MKNGTLKLLWLICFIPVCTSCLFLFGEPFDARDWLVNATSEPWTATADFISGKQEDFALTVGRSFGFGRTGRSEPMPVLTNIVVGSWGTPVTKYALSNGEISKLRSASGGELPLILYEEGIACMSPSTRRAFDDVYRKKPYNTQEHLRMLRNSKEEALRWTREVLGK